MLKATTCSKRHGGCTSGFGGRHAQLGRANLGRKRGTRRSLSARSLLTRANCAGPRLSGRGNKWSGHVPEVLADQSMNGQGGWAGPRARSVSAPGRSAIRKYWIPSILSCFFIAAFVVEQAWDALVRASVLMLRHGSWLV